MTVEDKRKTIKRYRQLVEAMEVVFYSDAFEMLNEKSQNEFLFMYQETAKLLVEHMATKTNTE